KQFTLDHTSAGPDQSGSVQAVADADGVIVVAVERSLYRMRDDKPEIVDAGVGTIGHLTAFGHGLVAVDGEDGLVVFDTTGDEL
ncbi:MAG TPA: hypothetical protein PLV68_02610, partial [Ilumatobacteraceae bacterium]|nr:hypothetical protein [Ilumatobacteraceae bacterium]